MGIMDVADMDVCGSNPTGKCGEHFHNNGWWWRLMAEYCNTVAPEICAPCRYWYSNGCDGLDAAAAVALAEALQEEVDSGRTERFARERGLLMPGPDECGFCGSDLPFGPPRIARDLKERGITYVRPGKSRYPFSTENVVNFIAFLRESGGFSIGVGKDEDFSKSSIRRLGRTAL
jgi:hypothetical protein